MFAEAFGDGSAFDLEIVYMTEETPLGTGGAIRNAAEALTCRDDAPVLVLNGDILSGHDITAQIDLHLSRKRRCHAPPHRGRRPVAVRLRADRTIRIG